MNDIVYRLERIERLLVYIGEHMAIDFTKLEASLKAETDAQTAVKALLVTLTNEIKKISSTSNDAGTQAKLDQLAMEVQARAADLSAATIANTPSA
jgi:arginyl-tRNA synthetase